MNKSAIIAILAFIVGGLFGATLFYQFGTCKTETKRMIFKLQTPGEKSKSKELTITNTEKNN